MVGYITDARRNSISKLEFGYQDLAALGDLKVHNALMGRRHRMVILLFFGAMEKESNAARALVTWIDDPVLLVRYE